MPETPDGMSSAEWRLRLELAACYRVFDWMGWTELVFNHITARVPGPEPAYLINPFGLWYDEITARNLVKIDLAGRILDGSTQRINEAGFIIHGAIHGARSDAHCIIHTHTTAGCAVAAKREGLRYDNFYGALLYGQVAYHDFEGVTTDVDEQPRLIRNLGNSSVLILRNHGLLVTGASIPQAFLTYWTLQRACEIQVTAEAMRGETVAISQAVLDATPARAAPMVGGPRPAGLEFDAVVRRAGIRYDDLA